MASNNWIRTPTTIDMGGRGNVPENAGISVSKKLFAPRVGLAYRLDDNTVIRAGYGINFDPIPFSRPLRGWYPLVINAANTAERLRLGHHVQERRTESGGSEPEHRYRVAAVERVGAQPVGLHPSRIRAELELHAGAQAAPRTS